MDWQLRYKRAHHAWSKKNYPLHYKDGHYNFNGFPEGKPSNKLTKICCNYLEWCGHDANRIDTKGTAKVDKNHAPKFNLFTGAIQTSEKVKFIPTQTKKGTADIEAKLVHPKHPFGVPWSIEIKIRDKQSPDQIKREASLKGKGLWYDIVHTPEEFFEAYDMKMELLNGGQLDPPPVFRLLIAGTRTFNDWELLKTTCDRLLINKDHVAILQGECKGADTLAKEYAKKRFYDCMPYPAEWASHGKSAGPIRNRQMAQDCDAAVIFWDGNSSGSKNMIEEMERIGKPYRVVRY